MSFIINQAKQAWRRFCASFLENMVIYVWNILFLYLIYIKYGLIIISTPTIVYLYLCVLRFIMISVSRDWNSPKQLNGLIAVFTIWYYVKPPKSTNLICYTNVFVNFPPLNLLYSCNYIRLNKLFPTLNSIFQISTSW